MTNKPMLSVEREMLERWTTGRASLSHLAEMRALLDKPACKECNDVGYLVSFGQQRTCWACKPAAQHQGEPVVLTEVEVSQFLTDALTAAGMVRHGKQDKKFAERLADRCVRVRSAWYAEQPAPVVVVMPELESEFEAWWESDGQYCRAGGGSYEKTFAYRAYEAALAEVARLNGVKP